jgi:hypothetical protein
LAAAFNLRDTNSTSVWGRPDSLRRFLLEGVKNIDGLAEFHGEHRAIRIPAMIFDDFKNAGTVSLPGLRLRMLASRLRDAQGNADLVLRGFGKVQQVDFCRSNPK